MGVWTVVVVYCCVGEAKSIQPLTNILFIHIHINKEKEKE